jgi:hypothetical protein
MRAIVGNSSEASGGTVDASSFTVSSSPERAEGDDAEASANSARPAESVMRLPARFPLSTEET